MIRKITGKIATVIVKIMIIPFDPMKIHAGLAVMVDQGIYPEWALTSYENMLQSIEEDLNGGNREYNF